MIIKGQVERGMGLARKLGCPTANLSLKSGETSFPCAPGVYAGWTNWKAHMRLPSLVCVHETSLHEGQKVEVHILNEVFDLYDSDIETHLIAKRRDLVPYVDDVQMSSEIASDMEWAQHFFISHK